MRRLALALVASALFASEAAAVAPLDNKQEFLYGPFRVPDAPPEVGAVPAALAAQPMDRSPLPKGVWLRFQSFGAARYQRWSAQMQIDDAGDIYLVTHLGDSDADKVQRPCWPARPSQKLDAATLADLRKSLQGYAAGPAYKGRAGLDYAPLFVLTVRGADGAEHQTILKGYEDDVIAHLRRISHYALVTPLPQQKSPSKPPAKAKPKPRPASR